MGQIKKAISRRTLLTSGAGGAIGSVLNSSDANEIPLGHEVTHDVYDQLGIKPIINAAGTITTLGGSLMPQEVIAAWNSAAESFVSLTELQDRVGEKIAELLHVDAALVTTGAAGGIMIATAAAMTHRDRDLVARLPLPTNESREVIRQKNHRECYDHQVTACGARLIDVESRDDLEQAINERTAMILSYNVQEGESTISRQEWLAAATKFKIPTLLDAAADTPPVDTLWRYNQMGYDMVVFSGGKAIRGPQDAGLLLGRKDLIEAAKLNTAPRCRNIGRGMKVSKEDMVAMWAAVQRFVQLDHAAEQAEWQRRIDLISESLADLPTITSRSVVPPIANRVPHLIVNWDEKRLKITPDEMKRQLWDGDPSIATARVHGTGDDGFLVSVFMLQEGEERIVARRMREILARAAIATSK